MIFSLPASQIFDLLGASLFLYTLCLAIHRLYFSRIAHIPGPRLAALTYYYQFYYDLYPHQGKFIFKLGQLHEEYGPTVRIGPDEVHVNDIEFYAEIYPHGARRRDKSALWFYHHNVDQIAGRSAWTARNHDVHRMRRAAFSQYFSRSKVLELQPRVSKKVELLKERLLAWEGSEELVDLYDAFSALTLEVITEYVFGRSVPVLHRADLGHEYAAMGRDTNKIHAVARAFPTLMRQFFQLPDWMMAGNHMFQVVKNLNDQVFDCTEKAFEEAVQPTGGTKRSITVMREIMESSSLPPEEKTLLRLKQEGIIFVIAGMETTARTLAATFYHILANPPVKKRLVEELRTVVRTSTSEVPALSTLEKLPYLTAIIDEGNRLAHGVPARLSRIAPDEDLVFNGYKIPRGVTVSESSYFLHRNPEVFPNFEEFHPERFLLGELYEGMPAAEALKNLVPFSKGARMCVGMNLAWAELYLTIAVLMTSIEMELVGTTMRDVTVDQEHLIGIYPEDSKGIRVKILGRA